MRFRIIYETGGKPEDEASWLVNHFCGDMLLGIDETKCSEHCCIHYNLFTWFTIVRSDIVIRVLIDRSGLLNKTTRVMIDICTDSVAPVYALYRFLARSRENPRIAVKKC